MALCKHIALESIRAATNGFDEARLLGEGGFGRVFHGVDAETGEQWAVKVAQGRAQKQAFQEEIERVAGYRHRNILRLVGYCNEGGKQILVYEVAAHGSLRSKLTGEARRSLTLGQRLDIAHGTAQALQYLHMREPFAIVHLDVKPDSILLDANMRALLADFGSLKLLIPYLTTATGRVSTWGYTEPEYLMGGHTAAACDVYSFGVVLLELVTGEPAILRRESSRLLVGMHMNSLFLAEWARQRGGDADLSGVWDPSLAPPRLESCLRGLFQLGIHCVATERNARPNIGQALLSLEGLMAKALVQEAREKAAEGKWVEAEALSRRAMAAGELALGVTHHDTLTAVEFLAAVVHHQGRQAEGEELARRAAAGFESTLGASHVATLRSLYLLGGRLEQQGRYAEAEGLFRRVVAGRESALGGAHADTLVATNDLAFSLDKQGRFAEAETLQRHALAGLTAALGERHPQALRSCSNLALTLCNRGRFGDAEMLHRRVLAGREQALPMDHIHTLYSMAYLASALDK